MPLSKKYADALKRFDRDAQYTPTEGLALVKSLASAKFDETVEMVSRLGVDPRKADQMVRGTVALPAGTGKTLRIAVFATGDAAQAARDAGAAVLLVSAELDEILSLADRVAVMFGGKIVAILEAKEAERVLVGRLMAGLSA